MFEATEIGNRIRSASPLLVTGTPSVFQWSPERHLSRAHGRPERGKSLGPTGINGPPLDFPAQVANPSPDGKPSRAISGSRRRVDLSSSSRTVVSSPGPFCMPLILLRHTGSSADRSNALRPLAGLCSLCSLWSRPNWPLVVDDHIPPPEMNRQQVVQLPGR